MNRSSKSLLEKFEERVTKGEDGHWIWIGSLHHMTGYGIFTVERRSVSAHILSWRLFRGEVPEGKWVRSRCLNRVCVNPDHLYLGDRHRGCSEFPLEQKSAE